MESLIFYIPILTALFFLTRLLIRKTQSFPPTPFPRLPILGHLYLFKGTTNILQSLTDLSSRYGPVLQLYLGSRRVLLVSSPSAAQDCLQRNDTAFANRPRLLAGDIFGYHYTTLIWAPIGQLWRRLRKVSATEILSPHRLHLLSGIRTEETMSLVRRLFRAPPTEESGADFGSAVDMRVLFFELMHNVVMRTIAGKRYYGEEEESEEGKRYKEILLELKEGVSSAGDFFPVLRRLGYGKKAEKRFWEVHGHTDEFMQGLVDQHRSRMEKEIDSGLSGNKNGSDGKVKSLIEVLLEFQKSEPDFFTDEIIKGLVLVLLVAGTDTTAATLEWVMSLLLNHPEILNKAQSEIDTQVGHDRFLEESDLCRLPYLQCIIHETMRMYPVGPLLMPHESGEDAIVGGYHVPRGTMLLVNVWAIQNDPKVWDDPRKFMPERFMGLEGDDKMHGFGHRLLPFGSGRRACPGEGMAMRILGQVLGSLIQCFEWERVGKELVDMKEKAGLAMPKAEPLAVKCRPREAMTKLISSL